MFPGLNGVSFPQNEEPLYSRDCRTFFITVPLKHSHHGTFRHINMISDRVRLLQMLFSRHFVALTKERKPDFLLMTKLVCLHGPEYPGDDWISENIIKLPWYLGKVERILCPYFIWWGINKTSMVALNRVCGAMWELIFVFCNKRLYHKQFIVITQYFALTQAPLTFDH